MKLVVVTDAEDTYDVCDNLEKVINHQKPEVIIAFINAAINEANKRAYDQSFGDDKICKCGHTYYRHFDSYHDMRPVGCKYCECYIFESNNV